MKNRILSYLQRDFTEPIRDPLWHNIYLSPGLLKVTASERFQQLGRIRQLGPAFHVYPGAVHTRLNHSLGVFQTAKKMITSLLVLSDTEEADRIGFSLTGIQSFLSAALLHDLGHFPFTHSFKELPLAEHEKLGAEIILGDRRMRRVLTEEAGADPEITAAIIDPTIPGETGEVKFYRNLLSGTLDPDKLDYLNRDAYFCGVPYGLQDVDYIIDRLRISGGVTCILESGSGAIEHLLFSKYLMYRNVYWHRTVRSATAMIKKAVSHALDTEELTASALYDLDDESFNRLCAAVKDRTARSALSLIPRVMHRNLYSCICEIPYDSSSSAHRELEDLRNRQQYESLLLQEITAASGSPADPWEVIIDIPENISFEANIPVIRRKQSSRQESELSARAESVFTDPVITRFTASLRNIRIFIPEHLAGTSHAVAETAETFLRGLQ